MSRTKGHDKHADWGVNAGRDLWAKRPCAGLARNKANRDRTIRVERNAERALLDTELLMAEEMKSLPDEIKGWDSFMELMNKP